MKSPDADRLGPREIDVSHLRFAILTRPLLQSVVSDVVGRAAARNRIDDCVICMCSIVDSDARRRDEATHPPIPRATTINNQNQTRW